MISYLMGDATKPNANGPKYIMHICNDIGAWGAGFVLALSKRWKKPEMEYRKLKNSVGYALGDIQIVQVEKDLYVVNMIAQHGLRGTSNKPPVSYEHLEQCFDKFMQDISSLNEVSVHMPKIGCGLGGGSWDIVEEIIDEHLDGIPVYVYTRS